jgi:DNA-binding response OmpR family regulator
MAELILVDDNDDVRDILAEFLRMEGHVVRVGTDGDCGLRLLADGLPDAALLDVDMPILSGPDMAYRMFVLDLGRENIPIVFLSGVPDLERIAAQVGTTYYLPKPFSLEALHEVLAKVLRERLAPTYPEARGDERAR